MKQFLIEWCKNMIIALVIIWYISIFFIVCYLLDDNTPKGAIYLFLWVVFYAVTTVTCYVGYYKK